MTAAQETAVTYTGRETPFVDRIYRSRLTFNPGQTRMLPALLAAKLLRHAEFEPAAQPEDAPAPAPAPTMEPVKTDDTSKLLDEAKKVEDEQRKKEDERFTLLQQIDKMDKQALRDWAKQTYKQDLPPQLGLEKMRDRVRGFVDQFGAL